MRPPRLLDTGPAPAPAARARARVMSPAGKRRSTKTRLSAASRDREQHAVAPDRFDDSRMVAPKRSNRVVFESLRSIAVQAFHARRQFPPAHAQPDELVSRRPADSFSDTLDPRLGEPGAERRCAKCRR